MNHDWQLEENYAGGVDWFTCTRCGAFGHAPVHPQSLVVMLPGGTLIPFSQTVSDVVSGPYDCEQAMIAGTQEA